MASGLCSTKGAQQPAHSGAFRLATVRAPRGEHLSLHHYIPHSLDNILIVLCLRHPGWCKLPAKLSYRGAPTGQVYTTLLRRSSRSLEGARRLSPNHQISLEAVQDPETGSMTLVGFLNWREFVMVCSGLTFLSDDEWWVQGSFCHRRLEASHKLSKSLTSRASSFPSSLKYSKGFAHPCSERMMKTHQDFRPSRVHNPYPSQSPTHTHEH